MYEILLLTFVSHKFGLFDSFFIFWNNSVLVFVALTYFTETLNSALSERIMTLTVKPHTDTVLYFINTSLIIVIIIHSLSLFLSLFTEEPKLVQRKSFFFLFFNYYLCDDVAFYGCSFSCFYLLWNSCSGSVSFHCRTLIWNKVVNGGVILNNHHQMEC